jgi:hypothetical protein
MQTTLKPAVMLSRLLVGPHRPSVFTETLMLLLAATDCTRGAVYIARDDALELVDRAGMPADLQRSLERLPFFGFAWFTAQRAAQSRTLVVDRDVAFWCGGRLDPGVLAAAGWGTAIACPVVSAGELEGVIVLATPANEEFSPDAMALLEIACALIGLHIGQNGRPQRLHEGVLPADKLHPCLAPTKPAIPTAAESAPTDAPDSAPSSDRRERALAAVARMVAEMRSPEGSIINPSVLEMLRRRGLSEQEAVSVITCALSTGILIRDAIERIRLATPREEPR